MKRQKGDKVRIKADLVVGAQNYNNISFVKQMMKYSGLEATIICVLPTYYSLDVDKHDGWSWSEDMLEDVTLPITNNYELY